MGRGGGGSGRGERREMSGRVGEGGGMGLVVSFGSSSSRTIYHQIEIVDRKIET